MVKTTPFRVFVIENDQYYNEYLAYHIGLNPDLEIFRYQNPKEALSNIHIQPHIITLDINPLHEDGELVIKKIKEADPDIYVILISNQDAIPTAVDLLRLDIYDYVVKDNYTTDRLWNTINHICESIKLKNQIEDLQLQAGHSFNLEKIASESHCMRKLIPQIVRATKTTFPVLITGEKGSGKSWLAKAIHLESSRKRNQFITINAGDLDGNEASNLLFGQDVTLKEGLVIHKNGKIEEAINGTLFIEDFHLLPNAVKENLLKHLYTQFSGPSRKFKDVNGARIILSSALSSDNLYKKEYISKEFYLFIHPHRIHLPLLRKRKKDIALVAKQFIEDYAIEKHQALKILSPDACEKLINHDYAGNFSELKDVVRRAMELSGTIMIGPEDISFSGTPTNKGFMTEKKTLREFTNSIIQYYLDINNGDVVITSEQLDIGKSTIYKLIAENQVKLRKQKKSLTRKYLIE